MLFCFFFMYGDHFQGMLFICLTASPPPPSSLAFFFFRAGRGCGVLRGRVVPDSIFVHVPHAIGDTHVAMGRLGNRALLQGSSLSRPMVVGVPHFEDAGLT